MIDQNYCIFMSLSRPISFVELLLTIGKLCSPVSSPQQKSYAEAGMSFLLDESDTVLAYENKGKTTEQEQAGTAEGRDPLMSALNTLGRVQQLEIIHGTRWWC